MSFSEDEEDEDEDDAESARPRADRTRALRAGFLVRVSTPVDPSALVATAPHRIFST